MGGGGEGEEGAIRKAGKRSERGGEGEEEKRRQEGEGGGGKRKAWMKGGEKGPCNDSIANDSKTEHRCWCHDRTLQW